jgi:hypothetical protein
MSRYSKEFMDEALNFAQNNPGRFLELANCFSSISTHEAKRSLYAWGIQVPVGDDKNTGYRSSRFRENNSNKRVPAKTQYAGSKSY